MCVSRTIRSWSPTITPHIKTVCANNTKICPTNFDKKASNLLTLAPLLQTRFPFPLASKWPDTQESNYLPLQNLCDWVWMKPRLASEEEVLRAHRPKHLERLLQPVDFDADTPYYTRIEEHARRAAGAAIGAVDLALRGEKAFALMRPPGHHATSTEAMGFCYLNSIAIAAHYALAIGCERVAIWDFDAHHGNGTEEIVLGNRRMRFASIHQYPGYPGTGTVSRGNVFNWPIPPHSDPEEHASTVHRALDELLDFRPS